MRDVFAIAKFLFELSSSSSFRDNRGPKFTLRSPAPPRRPLAEKFLTHPQVLAYTVTFQRHSSINVRLTEGSLYNRFRIKTSPKMGFWGDFGGRGEDIWWKSTSVFRIARFQTSLVQI